jgi:hypothetical protein
MSNCPIPVEPNDNIATVTPIDHAARNRRNRRAGARWQSTIRDGLRGKGFDVEALPLTGVEDEGDLVVRLGAGLRWVVIEAKAGVMHPAEFADQARTEAVNFAKHRGITPSRVTGVAVVKRRKQPWQNAYVLTDVSSYFNLTKDTLHLQPAGKWPRALCMGLRSAGLEAEQLRHNPNAPEGDLVIREGQTAKVIAARSGKLRVGELIDQMQAETVNYAKARDADPRRVEGIAVVRRRSAPWTDAYVLTTLGAYFGLGD